MKWGLEKHPRGVRRTRTHFAWLPTPMGVNRSFAVSGYLWVTAGWVWLEKYNETRVWSDQYLDGRFGWRLYSRQLPGEAPPSLITGPES